MRFLRFNFLLLLLFIATITSAQSLAVNTDGSSANASALLDVKSTVKGMLIPRMTRTERNAIASPATGLLIFQNAPDSIGFHYYDGSKWTWMFSNANADSLAWRTRGNTGTTATNNFLGTTDNVPLVIKTNNTERLRVTNTGEIGIGTTTPNSTYGVAKVEIASEDYGTPSDLLIRNAVSNPGYAPGLVFQHSRGTLAAPLTVVNGDYLAAIATMNFDGTGYVLSAGVDMYSDGAVSTNIIPTRLNFNTMNTSGAYSTRLTIRNDGKVGIATTSPNSTLNVDGTIAIGVTLTIAGGTSGSPTLITTQKSYLGLNPSGSNVHYRLPDPSTCPGRIYYVRNNDDFTAAQLGTVAGLICPGSGLCLASGAYYQLNNAATVKTVICISDGVNWTVGKID